MGGDRADTTSLGKAIAEITPALEAFYRFEGEDLAARQKREPLNLAEALDMASLNLDIAAEEALRALYPEAQGCAL